MWFVSPLWTSTPMVHIREVPCISHPALSEHQSPWLKNSWTTSPNFCGSGFTRLAGFGPKPNNKQQTTNNKLLHFEWSPPWHHIETYLSQILTFFVLKSGEEEKETIILMKSRALRPLDFIRIILSSSSLLLVRDPAVTTVIYLAKLIQTDSRYDWFKRISNTRASRDA